MRLVSEKTAPYYLILVLPELKNLFRFKLLPTETDQLQDKEQR